MRLLYMRHFVFYVYIACAYICFAATNLARSKYCSRRCRSARRYTVQEHCDASGSVRAESREVAGVHDPLTTLTMSGVGAECMRSSCERSECAMPKLRAPRDAAALWRCQKCCAQPRKTQSPTCAVEAMYG